MPVRAQSPEPAAKPVPKHPAPAFFVPQISVSLKPIRHHTGQALISMLKRSRTVLSSLPDLTARLFGRAVDFSAQTEPRPPIRLEDFLSIPIAEHGQDEDIRARLRAHGQFLARQERWQDLSDEIRAADATREATPGGTPVADLLAFGARSDVVLAVEEALMDSHRTDQAPLINGIRALEFVRQDHADDPYIALIVALTHIDLAWAWRGTGWDTIVPRLHREKCAAHFDRAIEILSPWCGVRMDSPVLQSACCALLAGRRTPQRRVADSYEELIDLDPYNPRHMRALGNHLLPRWFGSYAELELEARRTAARTQDIWGAGGYTWVSLDAIAQDEEACARVDVDFFVDGLRDIVRARPEQETINMLASYCAVTLRGNLGLHEEADLNRIRICNAADWLIRDHLTEVHPMIWAHAADGFDNNMRVSSPSRFAARGRADALQVIANLFRDEIREGNRVVFTPEGPQLHGA
ncbi:hypothetical protein KBY24_11690 [Ruegeria pomeroyi]|nr:hypothetical protein [Ruegeria pomeroyi]MCE8521469.1 hypothetical protein [Ruegeria pomeroyi]MCE8530318.1 hypothetical protein [Ruegeria pomeroyi]MCE8534048.1 hypothetical protein [Ruegeria pomeroyi]